MYRKLNIVFFLFLLHLRIYGQQCYTLVWSDEFEGNGAPNSLYWTCETGASGWGNNEVQNYTNSLENTWMENGNLVIEAKKTNNQWTSARLITAGNKTFTYGRIVFRAKLPAGIGTWPALWMLGADFSSNPWPACGEIDIMEHVGKNSGQVHASLHSPSSYGATQNTGITAVQNITSDFHLYRLDWTTDSIRFYVDDKLFYGYAPDIKNNSTWPFNKPFFLIMNIAMGGNWGSDVQYETGGLKNGIDPALTSARMEIDYVRVYQQSANPDISGPKIVNSAQTVTYSVPNSDNVHYYWEFPLDVQILSGQNTSQVEVQWGSTSGNVLLTITTACQTYQLNPYQVKARIKPDTSEFHFPVSNLNNQIIWEVATSPGNFFTLSLVPEWQIYYQISQPTNNPKLEYPLSCIYDFSDYKFLIVKLKNEKSNPPTAVRIDLVDINGYVNLDKVFKITGFNTNEQFNTYASGIESSSSFDLSNILELNMYINYGIFGKADTGSIYIQDLYLAKQFNLPVIQLEYNSSYIFPNPVSTSFTVKGLLEKSYDLTVVDINGKIVLDTTYSSFPINIEYLKSGIYSICLTDRNKMRYIYKLVKQ